MNEENNNNNQINDRTQLLEEQLKRALADYANLKNRYEKELTGSVQLANELLMTQMISVLDGLEMTAKEFYTILTRNGFSRIQIEPGTAFSAETMEVIDTDGKSDIVLEVLAPGYKLNDRVIRPAKVRLGVKD
ncbi:nucleotide exchange factor GrpE [candidate division WWE3 bacterium]|nr:nucleotide exchange factor GrpE [candidate division WWE3 bacterium]